MSEPESHQAEPRIERLMAENPPRSMLEGDPLERAVWMLRNESFHREATALVEYVLGLEAAAGATGLKPE